MNKLKWMIFLCIASTAQAQFTDYELPDSGSLDLSPSGQRLTLELQNTQAQIFNLSFDGCSTGPCVIDPFSTHTIRASVQADRCRIDIPQLGWQRLWENTSSQQFTTPEINFDVTITLSCENTMFEVISQSLEVMVDPNSCAFTEFPAGYTIYQDEYRWFNDDFPFGTSTNASFEANVRLDEFFVLDPISLPADTRRRFVFVNAPTQRDIDQATITVSTCPGDFTDSAVCQFQVTSNTTLFYSTRPGDANSFYCLLEPDTNYYINYILTPDPFNVPASCASAQHNWCTFFGGEAVLN